MRLRILAPLAVLLLVAGLSPAHALFLRPGGVSITAPITAPQVVQSTRGTATGCNTTNTTSCAATFAAGTGAGHAVLVGVQTCGLDNAGSCQSTTSNETIAVSDAAGNSCSLAPGTDSGAANGSRSLWFFCPSVTAGTTTFTATTSAAVDWLAVWSIEISNAVATEQGASAYTGSATSITCSTPNATEVANDLIFLETYPVGSPTTTLGSPWNALFAGSIWDQPGATKTTYSGAPSWGSSTNAACAIVAVAPSAIPVTIAGVSPTSASFTANQANAAVATLTATNENGATFTGSMALSGANSGGFHLANCSGATCVLEQSNSGTAAGTYTDVGVVVTETGATNSPLTQSLTLTGSPQTVSQVALNGSLFAPDAAAGTPIGALSTTLSPTSPAYSGSYTLINGGTDHSGTACASTNTTDFQVAGNELEVLSSSLGAGTYAGVCVQVSETGVAAYTQAFTLQAATGGTITVAQKVTPTTCAAQTSSCTANITVSHGGDLVTLGLGYCNGGNCQIAYPSTAPVSISDSQGNYCALVPGTTVGLTQGNADDVASSIAYCQDVSAGADAITVTWSASGYSGAQGVSTIWMSPIEWAGAAPQNPIDWIGGFNADNNGGNPPSTISEYAKANVAGDVIYSMYSAGYLAPTTTQTALNSGSLTSPNGVTTNYADQYETAGSAGIYEATFNTPGGGAYSGDTIAVVAIAPANSAQISNLQVLSHQTFVPNSPAGTPIGKIVSTILPAGQTASYSLASSGADHSGTNCASSAPTDFQIVGDQLQVKSASLSAGTYAGVCVVATDGSVQYVQAFTITGQAFAFAPNTLVVSNQSGAAANGSYSVMPEQFGRPFVDGMYPGSDGLNWSTQCPVVTGYPSVGNGTVSGATTNSTTATLGANAPASGTYYVNDTESTGGHQALAGAVTATISTSSATVTFNTAQSLPAGDVLTFYSETGQAVASQTDEKNLYPDGDLRYAVMAVQIPTALLPSGGAPSLLWITAGSGACNNTPISLSAMLSNYGADLKFNMTNPVTQTVSARQILTDAQNGSGCGAFWTMSYRCRYWTEGPVATTVLLTDDSQTQGAYDVGTGDGHTPLRPRFYLTFWQDGQVSYRFVAQDDLMNYTEDLEYQYNLCIGYPTCSQVFPASGNSNFNGNPLMKALTNFTLDDATTRTAVQGGAPMWSGGAPTNEIDVDQNILEMDQTHQIPNYDPSLIMDPSAIALYYKYLLSSATDPYYCGLIWGQTNCGGMYNGGAHDYLGPYVATGVLDAYSGDWRLRIAAATTADQALEWPMESLENRTGFALRRGDTGSTGLGFPQSITGNPSCNNSVACPSAEGTTGGNSTWQIDQEHFPQPFAMVYFLTGDPFYLNCLQEWDALTTLNVPVGYDDFERTPNGTFGSYGWFGPQRGMAWYERDKLYSAVYSPDADPFKAVATDWLNDALAGWEGANRLVAPEYDTSAAGGSYQTYVWGVAAGDNELCLNPSDPNGGTPQADGSCISTPLGFEMDNFGPDVGVTPAWVDYTANSSVTQPWGDDEGFFMGLYWNDMHSIALRLGANDWPEFSYMSQLIWGPIENLTTTHAEQVIGSFHQASSFATGAGLFGAGVPAQNWGQIDTAWDWKRADNLTGTFTASQSGNTLTVTSIAGDQPLNLNNEVTCNGCTPESLTGGGFSTQYDTGGTGAGGTGTYTMSVSQNISSTTFTQSFNGTVDDAGGPPPNQGGLECYTNYQGNCSGPWAWETVNSPNGYPSYGFLPASELMDISSPHGSTAWSFYDTNSYQPQLPDAISCNTSDNAYCNPGANNGQEWAGPMWTVVPGPAADPVILPALPTSSPNG